MAGRWKQDSRDGRTRDVTDRCNAVRQLSVNTAISPRNRDLIRERIVPVARAFRSEEARRRRRFPRGGGAESESGRGNNIITVDRRSGRAFVIGSRAIAIFERAGE